MSYVRVWLGLALCGVLLLSSGWVQPAAAASEAPVKEAPEVGGRGEGFQPEEKGEAKEEGKKEEAKEDECPSTFGPIITDTAIPIEKGKFALQPTFGLWASSPTA